MKKIEPQPNPGSPVYGLSWKTIWARSRIL